MSAAAGTEQRQAGGPAAEEGADGAQRQPLDPPQAPALEPAASWPAAAGSEAGEAGEAGEGGEADERGEGGEAGECALEQIVEALLFLSPEPLSAGELAQACERTEPEVLGAIGALGRAYAPGKRGIRLRELGGGYTFASDPGAEEAARALFARARLSKLTQAQAETLAIVAYLQPVSRPELARIRGVSADWAVTALLERDLIEEAGVSQFGAAMYRTTSTFLKLFGLRSLEALPEPAQWDPTPEEAGELRERLLRAGEARAGGGPQPS